MKEIYKAECITPTATITRHQKYTVFSDNGMLITIINDRGNKITVQRWRFGELEIEKVDTSVKIPMALCIDNTNFKSITKDTLYTIKKESKDFIYISNDTGKTMRYHKKYFDIVKPEKERPKVLKALCMYAVTNELTFKNAYDFEDDKRKKNMVIITNDLGVKTEYLRKRFKFEKV